MERQDTLDGLSHSELLETILEQYTGEELNDLKAELLDRISEGEKIVSMINQIQGHDWSDF